MTVHPRDFCLCAGRRQRAAAIFPARTKIEAAVRAHVGRAADERLAYLDGDGRRTEATVGDILEAMTIAELEQCLREPGPLAVRNLFDVLAEAADPGTGCRGRRALPVTHHANGAATMGAGE
ncbi:MAG TPA: hypothetical protein PLJ34_05470 [Hyphomicrobiales bacterium]|nr:hypothetical protein [Hyphomicrobiales bacterium]